MLDLGDFDWFAADSSGALGLFATAGQGFVPACVADFHVMHATVADSIEYPHWGTDEIWNDAAQLGLYVFDWTAPQGPYQRVASPTAALDDAIAAMIQRITQLPVHRLPFAEATMINQQNAFTPGANP